MTARASALKRYIFITLLAGMLALASATSHYLTEHKSGATKPAQTTASAQPAPQEPSGQAPIEGMSEKSLTDLSALMAQLQQDPKDARILTDIGRFFIENTEWQRAESFLNRAVLSTPSATVPRQLLGIAQYQQGKFAAAAETFAALLAMQEVPEVMYNLAIIYKYELNRQGDARHLLETLITSTKAGDALKAEAKKELDTPK